MKWNDPQRDAYLKMQEEADKNRRAVEGDAPRKPWRDRVYGGIRDKVTPAMMDKIIWGIVARIVVVVIIGVATGS